MHVDLSVCMCVCVCVCVCMCALSLLSLAVSDWLYESCVYSNNIHCL